MKARDSIKHHLSLKSECYLLDDSSLGIFVPLSGRTDSPKHFAYCKLFCGMHYENNSIALVDVQILLVTICAK